VNPYYDAYWSYARTIINAAYRRPLPFWFSGGTADLMANTVVKESTLEVGRPLPWALDQLAQGQRLRLRELVSVDGSSPWVTEPVKRRMFEAESWAFVHYLMFSNNGAHREQLNRFAQMLGDGKPVAEATDAAFGRVEAMDDDFTQYFRRALLQFFVLKTGVDVDRATFRVREMPPAEAAATRAAVFAISGREAEAREAIAQVRMLSPNLAAAYEVEGLLLDRERKTADAIEAFRQAMESGSGNYYVYYRWAVANWSPTADPELKQRVLKAAQRAIELNDRYIAGYEFLSSVELALDRRDEALQHAVRAVTLDPGLVTPRVSLVRLLIALDRRDEARKQADNAMNLATTEQERSAVRQVLNALNAPPPGARAAAVRDSAAPRAGGGPAPVRAGGSIAPPQKTKDVRPVYPADAATARVQGVVIVEATIGVDGRVSDARVLRSIPMLDEAALEAVREWEFTTTTLDGVAVPVIMTVTVNFSLQ
jgi:protein TonB